MQARSANNHDSVIAKSSVKPMLRMKGVALNASRPNATSVVQAVSVSTALRQAALVVSGEAGRAAVAVEGRWDGTMEDPDLGKRLFTVQLRNDKGKLAGSLTTWRGSVELRSPLREIGFDAGNVRFTASLQGTAFRFKGTLENNTVTGNIVN